MALGKLAEQKAYHQHLCGEGVELSPPLIASEAPLIFSVACQVCRTVWSFSAIVQGSNIPKTEQIWRYQLNS